LSEGDLANYEAQHGPGSASSAGLTAGGIINPDWVATLSPQDIANYEHASGLGSAAAAGLTAGAPIPWVLDSHARAQALAQERGASSGYWDDLFQQQADAAQQQIAAQFGTFNQQLQDYLTQVQQAGLVPAAAAPTAPMPQLGPDWATTWATLPQQQQAMLRGIGLDPELLRQLGWAI
jgi:hypothetical protein